MNSGAAGQAAARCTLVLDIRLHLAFQVIGRRAEMGLREELARLAAAADPQP
ncbi:MAG: hypothetical protein WCF04_02570 [Candidatus Nanopelagicales bacterium]